MAVTVDTHAAARDSEAAGTDANLTEAIARTVSWADAQPAPLADLVVLRLERRLIAWLVAAVLIVLALIRYLWPDASHSP